MYSDSEAGIVTRWGGSPVAACEPVSTVSMRLFCCNRLLYEVLTIAGRVGLTATEPGTWTRYEPHTLFGLGESPESTPVL